MPDYASMTGSEIRGLCRANKYDRPTTGVALGFAQANLVVLPRSIAGDFEKFCELNPKPCPLLEVLKPGQYQTVATARGADLRTDLPRYRVYRAGVCVDKPASIESLWDDNLVAFLIGCSFTFESALLDAGVPIRHIDQGCNVPMYRTNIECQSAGAFGGPLIVSMRPMTLEQAQLARRITASFPRAHGAPVHIGDAGSLGILDLSKPDYGDSVSIRESEIPVFWACGVTPIEVVARAEPELAITHDPGHMFVTDIPDQELRQPTHNR